MARALRGEVPAGMLLEVLDAEAARWHRARESMSLARWLGLSREQYLRWALWPASVLELLVALRALPVLFLDIDGVLNHAGLYARNRASGRPTPPAGWLDPKCVARVQRVCASAGLAVVVSSSWPLYLEGGIAETLRLLHDAGMEAPVLGACPTVCPTGVEPEDCGARAEAIQRWLELHGERPWAVLDDRPWRGLPADRWVHPDLAVGVTDEDLRRLLGLLAAQSH